MANLTIYEFFGAPNAANECIWPADLTTAVATAATHALNQNTRALIVCADADSHIQINANGVSTAATTAGLPILSAVSNQFTIAPASGQTLKFA